jgi:hypothetical protein
MKEPRDLGLLENYNTFHHGGIMMVSTYTQLSKEELKVFGIGYL